MFLKSFLLSLHFAGPLLDSFPSHRYELIPSEGFTYLDKAVQLKEKSQLGQVILGVEMNPNAMDEYLNAWTPFGRVMSRPFRQLSKEMILEKMRKSSEKCQEPVESDSFWICIAWNWLSSNGRSIAFETIRDSFYDALESSYFGSLLGRAQFVTAQATARHWHWLTTANDNRSHLKQGKMRDISRHEWFNTEFGGMGWFQIISTLLSNTTNLSPTLLFHPFDGLLMSTSFFVAAVSHPALINEREFNDFVQRPLFAQRFYRVTQANGAYLTLDHWMTTSFMEMLYLFPKTAIERAYTLAGHRLWSKLLDLNEDGYLCQQELTAWFMESFERQPNLNHTNIPISLTVLYDFFLGHAAEPLKISDLVTKQDMSLLVYLFVKDEVFAIFYEYSVLSWRFMEPSSVKLWYHFRFTILSQLELINDENPNLKNITEFISGKNGEELMTLPENTSFITKNLVSYWESECNERLLKMKLYSNQSLDYQGFNLICHSFL